MSKYRVKVLMATHNGMSWLMDQVETVLSQSEVEVKLYVSDDVSSDGTFEFLNKISKQDPRVFLLPPKKIGGAGRNFYRLIEEVNLEDCEYAAFSDQDDIWESNKLIRHIKLAEQHQADGVSSNVLAFWADGSQKLIVKSQSQKKWDFLFESAGPGCSFLMTQWLVTKVREQLMDEHSPANTVVLHDWLTYAVCRANGRHWVIDEQPSARYRQHGNNVVGANVGVKAAWVRLLKIKRHWYRNEVLKVAEVSRKISNDSKVDELVQLLRSNSFFARFKLLKFVPQARRSTVDRMALTFAIVVGLF